MTADTNIAFFTLHKIWFPNSINNRYPLPFFFAYVGLNNFPIHLTEHSGLYLHFRLATSSRRLYVMLYEGWHVYNIYTIIAPTHAVNKEK